METMLRVEEAADALGLSRTKTFGLVIDGRLRSVKIGRSRRVPASSIDEFVRGLLDEQA